jgi:hypothetical protein
LKSIALELLYHSSNIQSLEKGLQRAARQIVLDAEHGIILSEVDLACQFLDSPA